MSNFMILYLVLVCIVVFLIMFKELGIYPFTATTKEEIADEKLIPKQIKIIKSSNQFSWYAEIAKIKDEDEKVVLKFYDIEPTLSEHGFYRTVTDVAGPNVKGFINVNDVEIISYDRE